MVSNIEREANSSLSFFDIFAIIIDLERSNAMRKFYFYLFPLTLVLLIFNACQKESFTTDKADKLVFSSDTISFDTVFTAIGSTTKFFKVINPHDKSIKVSNIRLANHTNFFNINIDGVPTDESKEINILPNDSLYIFVEVTIDPDMPVSVSPFIVEDEILFSTNGNDQKVHLVAWGQNANYFTSKDSKGKDVLLTCDLGKEIWSDPKPYVIYGRLFIDSCELVIPAGRQIYVHGGIAIRKLDDGRALRYNDGAFVFYNKGKLTVNGTIDEPVVFQGTRLEPDYDDIAGQWVGLYFVNQSQNNTINHTIIKNSIRGCYIDSASELSIKESAIFNTLGPAIEAVHARVDVQNSLLYNNQTSAIQILYGGDYTFDYCTIVNNDNSKIGVVAYNYYCEDFSNCPDDIKRFYPLKLDVNNSIIVGEDDDELILVDGLDGQAPSYFDCNFNNCIITMDQLSNQEYFDQFFSQIINSNGIDSLFLNLEEFDFHLDTFSIAERKAIPISNISDDLDGVQRDGLTPDIGCYEFVE